MTFSTVMPFLNSIKIFDVLIKFQLHYENFHMKSEKIWLLEQKL